MLQIYDLLISVKRFGLKQCYGKTCDALCTDQSFSVSFSESAQAIGQTVHRCVLSVDWKQERSLECQSLKMSMALSDIKVFEEKNGRSGK